MPIGELAEEAAHFLLVPRADARRADEDRGAADARDLLLEQRLPRLPRRQFPLVEPGQDALRFQARADLFSIRPSPGAEVALRGAVIDTESRRIAETARRIGVTRVALSRVLNGRAAISADMAVRLTAALGGSAESWLHMQANYDLWKAEKSLKRQVARIAPLKRAA